MTYTDSENVAICMDALVKAVDMVDAERYCLYEQGIWRLRHRKACHI